MLSDARHKDDELSSSYTATLDNIRGETAELADMVVNEESDNSAYETETSPVQRLNRPHRSSLYTQCKKPASEYFPFARSDQNNYGALFVSEETSARPDSLDAVDSQWTLLRNRMDNSDETPTPSPHTYLRNFFFNDVLRLGLEPLQQLPAVLLGVLLNILDGVSYGMITFPTSMSIFSDFGGDGVCMFFVTCIIAQLVYTCGGSVFKGGNGSMMIEVVPFYHILVKAIVGVVGEDDPVTLVATTMVAFALSSVLTGLAFLLLGMLRLGVVVSYFPRHILVGCIGGVGVFLMETGFAVAAHLESESGFKYDLETLRALFASAVVATQWALPLGLAVLLNILSSRIKHPMFVPTYFMIIPALFYTVAFVVGLDMATLWRSGWVFNIGSSANAPFYRFYKYFDLRATSWEALWATMPTQMALVFFGILHVPLNVPALGVSVGEDHVDTNREFVAHGISNITAGCLGTVPNYLCYVNSVLFYRVGGGSRLSGLMLAGATAIVMILGPGLIAYLPIMVVAALIFVLGIDLVREALWDTLGRVNRLEYVTIIIMVITMTKSDFVVGSLVGTVLACLFFVMQTSRRSAVRSVLNGHSARSTVRRHPVQRRFLEEAGFQTQIIKLQASLFFGTINPVEQLIRKLMDLAVWEHSPIRFLVMDVR